MKKGDSVVCIDNRFYINSQHPPGMDLSKMPKTGEKYVVRDVVGIHFGGCDDEIILLEDVTQPSVNISLEGKITSFEVGFKKDHFKLCEAC